LAQWLEHLIHIQGVRGSNPLLPTIDFPQDLASKSSGLNVSSGALPSLSTGNFVAKTQKNATKMQQNPVAINRPKNPYEAFINEKISRGLTKSAISGYKYHLSSALEVLDPYSATKEDIVEYLNSIPVGKDNDLVTRFARHNNLKVFFNWLEDNEYIDKNPMKTLKQPKIIKDKIMPTLTEDEIRNIMSKQNTKGRALISLATASGLRLSELANIKIEDIDFQNQRIKTLGKGRKEAYAPISFAENDLKSYLKESGIKSGSLFGYTRQGMKTYFRRLSTDKNKPIGAHMFRRSFATILKSKGLDIETIRILGRWEKLDMPIKYTRAFTFDDANKLMQKATSGLFNDIGLPTLNSQ
jgi:integrase/recombinase XerD